MYLVYVKTKNGKPLMPTKRCGRVRKLLKEGKAKVICKCPFTIKLLYDSTEYTQKLSLGIDVGSSHIGSAVVNEKGDAVYMAETTIKNDIKDKMEQRRMYRRNRRSRKTRYRKARFLNRKNSTKKGRLPPTLISKIHSHVKEIEFVKSILPVTDNDLIFETAKFDMHLLKNPKLHNEKYRHFGYQKGILYGYANAREYVLERDNHECQICCKKEGYKRKKHLRLETHHIVYRSRGGSDDPRNLITVCPVCHPKIHDGKITIDIEGMPFGVLRHDTHMNIISKRLVDRYPNAIETYGYITKQNRFEAKLPKRHYIDACIIANGGPDINFKSDIVYIKRSVTKGDYRQTRGERSEIRMNRGKVNGFRRYDKVQYKGNIYFIKGLKKGRYADLMDINNKTIKFPDAPKGEKTPKLSKFKRISARKSCIIDIEKVNIANVN